MLNLRLPLLPLLLVVAMADAPAWAQTSAAPAVRAFDLQGHRGARGLAPENTLPSFQKALDLGVDTLECDMAITRDGVPYRPSMPRQTHFVAYFVAKLVRVSMMRGTSVPSRFGWCGRPRGAC